MRLESDPTVIYGLIGGRGSLGRGLTKAELQQATPYNTYLLPGLPAGPITNPGRAALEAVANPSRTKDLYFVADGTGGHVFADTYEQHLKNVAKWRQIEGDKADPAPSAQPPVSAAAKAGAAADATDGTTKPAPQPNTNSKAKPSPTTPKLIKKKAANPDVNPDAAAAPD